MRMTSHSDLQRRGLFRVGGSVVKAAAAQPSFVQVDTTGPAGNSDVDAALRDALNLARENDGECVQVSGNTGIYVFEVESDAEAFIDAVNEIDDLEAKMRDNPDDLETFGYDMERGASVQTKAAGRFYIGVNLNDDSAEVTDAIKDVLPSGSTVLLGHDWEYHLSIFAPNGSWPESRAQALADEIAEIDGVGGAYLVEADGEKSMGGGRVVTTRSESDPLTAAVDLAKDLVEELAQQAEDAGMDAEPVRALLNQLQLYSLDAEQFEDSLRGLEGSYSELDSYGELVSAAGDLDKAQRENATGKWIDLDEQAGSDEDESDDPWNAGVGQSGGRGRRSETEVVAKGFDPAALDLIAAVKNKIEQVLESNIADGSLDEDGAEDAEAWAERVTDAVDDISQEIGSGSFTDASYSVQALLDSTDSMGIEEELQALQDYLESDGSEERTAKLQQRMSSDSLVDALRSEGYGSIADMVEVGDWASAEQLLVELGGDVSEHLWSLFEDSRIDAENDMAMANGRRLATRSTGLDEVSRRIQEIAASVAQDQSSATIQEEEILWDALTEAAEAGDVDSMKEALADAKVACNGSNRDRYYDGAIVDGIDEVLSMLDDVRPEEDPMSARSTLVKTKAGDVQSHIVHLRDVLDAQTPEDLDTDFADMVADAIEALDSADWETAVRCLQEAERSILTPGTRTGDAIAAALAFAETMESVPDRSEEGDRSASGIRQRRLAGRALARRLLAAPGKAEVREAAAAVQDKGFGSDQHADAEALADAVQGLADSIDPDEDEGQGAALEKIADSVRGYDTVSWAAFEESISMAGSEAGVDMGAWRRELEDVFEEACQEKHAAVEARRLTDSYDSDDAQLAELADEIDQAIEDLGGDWSDPADGDRYRKLSIVAGRVRDMRATEEDLDLLDEVFSEDFADRYREIEGGDEDRSAAVSARSAVVGKNAHSALLSAIDSAIDSDVADATVKILEELRGYVEEMDDSGAIDWFDSHFAGADAGADADALREVQQGLMDWVAELEQSSASVETRSADLSALLDQAADHASGEADPRALEFLQDARRAADAGLWADAQALVESASEFSSVGYEALIDALQSQIDAAELDLAVGAREDPETGPTELHAAVEEKVFFHPGGNAGVLNDLLEENGWDLESMASDTEAAMESRKAMEDEDAAEDVRTLRKIASRIRSVGTVMDLDKIHEMFYEELSSTFWDEGLEPDWVDELNQLDLGGNSTGSEDY